MQEAFAAENEHLVSVLRSIDSLVHQTETETESAYDQMMSVRASEPDLLPIREMIYFETKRKLEHLRRSGSRPYFTRIDFAENNESPLTCYIGKYGVMDPASHTPIVYDWRAPISNLYYCGQLGHVNYQAPDGTVEGELLLKRQLEIEKGKLLSVFDTDIVSQDSYLQKALSAQSGQRLKDIVTTIQSEQNIIIRHPLHHDLIVQGAAGSGKTTVALHRIAYLLYAYADRLKPERMLVLAPSPLFLDYISGVLPDLGVENTAQTTYCNYFSDWLGLKSNVPDASARLEERSRASASERDKMDRISSAKGSLAFRDALEAYLERYEHSFVPENGIVFGPAALWSKAEAEKFLLVDEAPFPMTRRVAQFKQQLTKRANAAVRSINAWFKSETDRRAQIMRQKLTGDELNLKLKSLYESRDARIAENNAQIKSFVDSCIKAMPPTEPLAVYREFLGSLAGDPALGEAAADTLEKLKAKKIQSEDLAPLAVIALRTRENENFAYRHIVIDEAQDLSPMQIHALKLCQPEASFTLVGDLMQGITANRGVERWEEITQGVFDGKSDLAVLSTSYRSTVPIMKEAFKAARGLQDNGSIRVIRSGNACTYRRAVSPEDKCDAIRAAISNLRSEGYESIAVITSGPDESIKVFSNLSEEIGAVLLRSDMSGFASGVYVTDAAAAKGLEFDAVVLSDAGEKYYSSSVHDARLLYVAITRALHSLTVVYTGSLTPLLL